MTVEQRAEFSNIVGQMFRRHTGIFRKRNRFGRAFGITQQTNRFFPHGIDTLHARQLRAQLPADHSGFLASNQLIQTLAQGAHLSINSRFVIPGELDDVQAQHLFIRHIGNQLTDGVPDDVLPRQIKHFRIDGFHRERPRFDHKGRVTQRGIKRVIFDVHQTANFRQRSNIQTRFRDKRQRAFRTGQHAR